MPQIPLYEGGVVTGQGAYEVRGLHVCFRCRLAGKALCKVELVRGNCRSLLGTPLPTGEGLALERTLSRAELERAGVWPPERMETVGRQEDRPELDDPILRGVFTPGQWQWRRLGTGWEASRLWDGRGRFPALPVLCLAALKRQGEVWRVTCRLDGEGRPQMTVD